MKFLFSKKIILLELLILVLAVPAAIFLLQTPQRTTPKASSFNTRLSLPTTLSTGINQVIDVPLFINTGTASIKGADVQIQYDTSVLTLQDVLTDGKTTTPLHTFSPLTSSGVFDTAKVISGIAANGNLRTVEFSALAFEWSTKSSTGSYTTNGQAVRIATLRFSTKAAAITTITLVKNGTSTIDSNIAQAGSGTDILDFVDSLKLTIAGPTNTPVPTATPIVPTPTKSPTPLPTTTTAPPTPTKSPTPKPSSTISPPTPSSPQPTLTKIPTPIPTATSVAPTLTKSPTPNPATATPVPSLAVAFSTLKTAIVNYLTGNGQDYISDGKRNMLDAVFVLKKL